MSGGDRRLLGRWGEAAAAEYLKKQGYHLLAVGWQCRFGEIDLIMRDGSYLAFVEVKLRKSDSFAKAREFVTAAKQNRLRTTAEVYLSEHPAKLQPRFDVVEVYAPQGIHTAAPEIHHWINAFE
jgi:putative endonuclease